MRPPPITLTPSYLLYHETDLLYRTAIRPVWEHLKGRSVAPSIAMARFSFAGMAKPPSSSRVAVLSIAAVTLPALIAAGIPSQNNRRQVLAAAAASIIAVTSFMQAGEKATAHAHAYVCMRIAMAAYRSELIKLDKLHERAEKCSRYIDYDYLEARQQVPKGTEDSNP